MQRFADITNSTFFVKTAGSHYKRLVRTLGTVPRAIGALRAAHRHAARCGSDALLAHGQAEDAPKRSPQKAYLMALHERLHPDTFHITIKKRLTAWFLRPPVPVRQEDPAVQRAIIARERLDNRAAHWAGSWLPDVLLSNRDIINKGDWEAWCEEYVYTVLGYDMFQPLYHSRRVRRFIAQENCDNAWRTSNMARSRLELAMLGDKDKHGHEVTGLKKTLRCIEKALLRPGEGRGRTERVGDVVRGMLIAKAMASYMTSLCSNERQQAQRGGNLLSEDPLAIDLDERHRVGLLAVLVRGDDVVGIAVHAGRELLTEHVGGRVGDDPSLDGLLRISSAGRRAPEQLQELSSFTYKQANFFISERGIEVVDLALPAGREESIAAQGHDPELAVLEAEQLDVRFDGNPHSGHLGVEDEDSRVPVLAFLVIGEIPQHSAVGEVKGADAVLGGEDDDLARLPGDLTFEAAGDRALEDVVSGAAGDREHFRATVTGKGR